MFSIVNDYISEEEDNLAEEKKTLLAVRKKRTERQSNESAENFLLTREEEVRFVQDYIANVVDRQKCNADKNERANVFRSFKVNDLVLLSTVNLPGHAVTNVGSSKLLPKNIGPFRVLHRKGNAYKIELPRRIRTHPTFYVGRLRPYYQHKASSENVDSRHAQESHHILVVTEQTLKLVHQQRGLSTSRFYLVAQTTILAFARELNEREIRSVILPIGTKTSYRRLQVVLTVVLVVDVLPQLGQDAFMVIQSFLPARRLSRNWPFHRHRNHWWILAVAYAFTWGVS